jgi:hypothetical protein
VTAHALARLTAVTEPDRTRPPGERVVAGLVAYLGHLRADTTGWIWLLRGGGSGDERLWAVGEVYRVSIEEWVHEVLPASARTPLVRIAVRGWIGSNTEMALAWLSGGEVALADVVRLMVSVLLAALEEAGVDPGVLAQLRGEAASALAALS